MCECGLSVSLQTFLSQIILISWAIFFSSSTINSIITDYNLRRRKKNSIRWKRIKRYFFFLDCNWNTYVSIPIRFVAISFAWNEWFKANRFRLIRCWRIIEFKFGSKIETKKKIILNNDVIKRRDYWVCSKIQKRFRLDMECRFSINDNKIEKKWDNVSA